MDRSAEVPYALIAELEDALKLTRASLLERGGFHSGRDSLYVADVLRRAERWRLGRETASPALDSVASAPAPGRDGQAIEDLDVDHGGHDGEPARQEPGAGSLRPGNARP